MTTSSQDSAQPSVEIPRAMTALRFLTCGSVDDGKSTLLGRMLFDAGLVPDDQWAAVQRLSAERGLTGEFPDFSLLFDGLLDERSQGITIDVAWRYFQTERRKFIVADTPGHEQYTRNMATGASQCDLALILVDAHRGITQQTRRHAAIVHIMGIDKVLVAINKMDLVGWEESTFKTLRRNLLAFTEPLGLSEPVQIPVSALRGENVVQRSTAMPWYSGPTLLDYLETVDAGAQRADAPLRLPVQRVTRADNFRGYSGTVARGVLGAGSAVTVLPGKIQSQIASIVTFDGELDLAVAGQAVTVTLDSNVDVTRGDVIVAAGDASPTVTDRMEANIIW